MFSTRVAISEINEGADGFELTIRPEDLKLEYKDAIFESPVITIVESHRTGLEITLIVSVETTIGLVCARCLEKFDFPFRSAFELHLKGLKGGQRVVDFVEEDFAFIEKDMGLIDLEERIRDEIILEIPKIPLCKDNCAGIEYTPSDEAVDPRWLKLKELKQK
jgi:uncharacterized protein